MFSLRALIDRQRKKREGTILADDGEIALLRHDGTASWRFKWGDVREIAAWKDDLITTDIIRLGFRVGDEEECPCCCEEQAGWDELLVVMERVLGVARSDWWDIAPIDIEVVDETVVKALFQDDPVALALTDEAMIAVAFAAVKCVDIATAALPHSL